MKIDKVYLINLDISKDRLKTSDEQLQKLGGVFADYKRISGINAKELSDEYIKSLTTPYSYYYLKNPRVLHNQIDKIGAIGASLSHIKIWKDMIDNNYENIIIFEDDFNLTNPEIINEYIDNLPIDTQIAYFFYTTFEKCSFKKINKYWKSSLNLYITSAMCYMLNINLAKKLYRYSLPIDTHIDIYMNYYCLSNNINRYYINKNDIIMNDYLHESLIGHNTILNILINHELLNPYYIIIVQLIILLIIVLILKKKIIKSI